MGDGPLQRLMPAHGAAGDGQQSGWCVREYKDGHRRLAGGLDRVAAERVEAGDLLAAPAPETLGARIHASISGVVTSVNGSVVIEAHA